MVSATIILIGVVVLLLLLNFAISRVPKRNQQVKVSFIPPSNPPSSDETMPPVDFMGQLNAHVQATNVKITQLFSRMEDIEKRVFSIEKSLAPAKEETWIETVPVRAKKK